MYHNDDDKKRKGVQTDGDEAETDENAELSDDVFDEAYDEDDEDDLLGDADEEEDGY